MDGEEVMNKEATEVKAIKNELYYTDYVEDVISAGLIIQQGTVDMVLDGISQFHDNVLERKISWEAEGVKNIFATLAIEGLHDLPTVVCNMRGNKPWSEEKIKEFEGHIKEKKPQDDNGELDLLASLIEQNPDAALEILAKLLKGK
jgi:hypothetical protein